MSPLHSGLLILPYIVMEALGGVSSGVAIYKTGRYLELTYLGVAVLTLGTGLFIMFKATTSLATLIIIQIVAGGGSGLLFEPPVIALQAMVKQDEVATATGCLGFIRNMATALGVVIGGVIFQNGMETRSGALSAAGLSPELVEKFSGHRAESNIPLVEKIADAGARLVVKEAYAWSLRNMWIFYTATAALGMIGSVFIAKALVGHEHTETRTGLKEREKRSEGVVIDPATELRALPPLAH
jgi:hypothetical protein